MLIAPAVCLLYVSDKAPPEQKIHSEASPGGEAAIDDKIGTGHVR
jgi:hypothetical protein